MSAFSLHAAGAKTERQRQRAPVDGWIRYMGPDRSGTDSKRRKQVNQKCSDRKEETGNRATEKASGCIIRAA